MARTSLVARGDTWIELLVQLDQGDDVTGHYITITLDGQTSPDLGYRHHSGNIHWSRSYTFYGLTPGTTYWASGYASGLYVDGNYYTTTGTKPQPPPTPNMSQWSASGRNITMQVWNTGNATSLNFYTSWNGQWSYGYSPNNTYYTFTAPQYGGHYEIWVEGYSAQGYSNVKKAYAYSVPNSPVLTNVGILANTVTVGVSTSGYYDSIAVEMYTATGTLYTTKYLYWDGSLSRYGELTFSALTPGASYTFKAKSIDNDGYTSPYSNNLNITNNSPPSTPSAYHYSSSGKTITLDVGNDSHTTSLYFKPSWRTYWTAYTANQGFYSFEAPQYGTEYTIAVYAKGAGGDSGEKIAYVMSDPRIPSLSNLGITQGEITVGVSTQGIFDQIKVELYPYGSGNPYATRYINWAYDTSLNTTVTFVNLTPNATYNIRATVTRNATMYTYNRTLTGGNMEVIYEIARPDNWEWNTPKSSGNLFSMSATEWNAFATRINQFREYKGWGKYEFTNAQPGGYFYFQMFNETKAAIDAMATTGVGTVMKGSYVSANDLNILRNTLNVI